MGPADDQKHHRRTSWTGNEQGSVVLVVAAGMLVILGFLALVLDGGYLYATRNKYQNAVEAAAMAGAIHLCGSDPELTAREIARENDVPYSEEEGLVVVFGFYDEHDDYGDFPEYKDFVEDPFPETSRNEAVRTGGTDPEYNNAVLVSLNGSVDTALAGVLGYHVVQVSAAAVAYLERYLMVSLEEDGEGITTASKSWDWTDGGGNSNHNQPQFRNGNLYSNGDITFFTGTTCTGPTFVDSKAYAHGTVSPEELGTNQASLLTPPGTDWEALREAAETHGKVIDSLFFQTLPQYNKALRKGVDRYGNCYRCNTDGSNPYFTPRPGNHDGRTYYVSEDVGDSLWIGDVQCSELYSEEYDVTNLTLAFESDHLGFNHDTPVITWGGEEADETVRFYGRDLMMGAVSDYEYASDSGNLLEGVVFNAERDFGYRPAGGGFGDAEDLPPEIRKLRVFAGERIIIGGYEGYIAHQDRYPVGFDANFGPPCPPSMVRLGMLEHTDD